jgi:hypothetical protein
VFSDVAVNQMIEVTEFADEFRKLDWKLMRMREAAKAD